MSEEGIPAVEPDATPEPDESSEAPQSANSDSGNYHERIRSEGEFAVEEVQKKDRYIGELHAKTNAYKPLEPFIQAVGSVDDFIELAILGDKVRREQSAQPAAPAEPEQQDSEIYDPEIKALDERYRRELAARDKQLASMQQQLTIASTNASKGALTENIGSALEEFSAFPELEAKARDAIMGAVEASERLVKSGDGTAAKNLEQLADPQKGPQAIRMVLADIYREMALAAAAPRKEQDLSKDETKIPRSTDAPSGVRSMLGADDVSVAPGTRVTANTIREIMEAVAKKRGKL